MDIWALYFSLKEKCYPHTFVLHEFYFLNIHKSHFVLLWNKTNSLKTMEAHKLHNQE